MAVLQRQYSRCSIGDPPEKVRADDFTITF